MHADAALVSTAAAAGVAVAAPEPAVDGIAVASA